MGLYTDEVGLVVAYQFWPGLTNPGVWTDFPHEAPGAYGILYEAATDEYVRVLPGDWITTTLEAQLRWVVPDWIFRELYTLVEI